MDIVGISYYLAKYLLCLIVVYFLISVIMGYYAGIEVGRPVFWAIAFVVLPGISYIAFAYQYFYIERKRRRFKERQEFIYGRSRPVLGLGEYREKGKPTSVTPFEVPIHKERLVEPEQPVLTGWRDKQVEELMSFDQWGKAMELAHERLELARSRSDSNAIELYREYLATIMSNMMPSYNNDPLELDSDRSRDARTSPPE